MFTSQHARAIGILSFTNMIKIPMSSKYGLLIGPCLIIRSRCPVGDAPPAIGRFSHMRTSQLPPSIDLRNSGGFPAVYEQCGLNSCTAAAAAALARYEMHFQNGDAGVFEPSRMFLYHEERGSGRTGFRDRPIQMEECIRAIVRSGICAEELWPYIPERAGDAPPSTAYDSAFRPRIARRLTQNLDDLRGCLAEGHPFVCGVALYPSVHGVATRTTGAIAMPVAGERVRSGHAILIVGYDDVSERFILRNSLGPDWGNRGHGTIPYRYMLDAALAYDFWTLREFVSMEDSRSRVPSVIAAESRAFDVATPLLGAPDPDGDLLDPQWPITFAANSLSDPISQPIIVPAKPRDLRERVACIPGAGGERRPGGIPAASQHSSYNTYPRMGLRGRLPLRSRRPDTQSLGHHKHRHGCSPAGARNVQ